LPSALAKGTAALADEEEEEKVPYSIGGSVRLRVIVN
jgi:hypothetical protein